MGGGGGGWGEGGREGWGGGKRDGLGRAGAKQIVLKRLKNPVKHGLLGE